MINSYFSIENFIAEQNVIKWCSSYSLIGPAG